MMRLYIAAPWVHRLQAIEAADYLAACGFQIRAHWLRGHVDTNDPVVLQKEALQDVNDVQFADAFVLLNLARSDGKAFELGMAYELGVPIVVVGPNEGCVFYHLPGIIVVDTIQEAAATLHKIEWVEV